MAVNYAERERVYDFLFNDNPEVYKYCEAAFKGVRFNFACDIFFIQHLNDGYV